MIPRFDSYYEHLQAGFIHFDRFLAFLKNEFFNGFVLAENQKKWKYFFMFEGELLSAFSVFTAAGKLGFEQSNELSVEKDCVISAWRCPHRYIDYFSAFQTSRLLYGKVSTQKIPPDKLLGKLNAERFTGFIEIQGGNPSTRASYIYFQKGSPIGGLNVTDSQGQMEPDITLQEIQKVLHGSLINIYTFLPQIRNQGEERKQLINCFQGIFEMLEARSQSDFSTLWRKCAKEISPRYEFLDPLIGEFQYKNRQIRLYDKIDLRTAAVAINELVYLIAGKLSISGDEIQTMKKNFSSVLAAYEIRD